MVDKKLEKINLLYSSNCTHYYAYFDETILEEHNLLVSVMVLTNDKNGLTKTVNNIKFKAQRDFPGISKSGVLHFTDFLNQDCDEFLKWALKKINKLDILVFFNFVDLRLPPYRVVPHKMSGFVSDFLKLWESKLKKENITFVFDEGFLPKNKVRKYFFIIHDYSKSHSGARFIPEVPKFYDDIKECIGKSIDFMVFPTEKAKIEIECGIQVADIIAGALRQNFKGNSEFIDVIRTKFVQEGSSGTFESGYPWKI